MTKRDAIYRDIELCYRFSEWELIQRKCAVCNGNINIVTDVPGGCMVECDKCKRYYLFYRRF